MPCGARTSRSCQLPDRRIPPRATSSPPSDQPLGRAPARAPASGPGPAPAHALAQRGQRGAPCRAPGSSGARRSIPRAAHTSSHGEDARRGCATAARSLRAAPQPIDTWSSCIALVGSESTLAGAARRRFSATIAACVYWAIISPELTPGVLGEERRQAVRAGARRAGGRCAARRSRRPRRRRSPGSRRRSATGAPWKLPHDSTRPSGSTIGLSIADTQLGRGHPLGVGERVARGAVHLRRAAQRVGVLHARVVRSGGWPRSASRPAARAGWRRCAAWPGCGRSAIRSSAKARSVPSSASTDIAAVTSATRSSRRGRASASSSMPSMPSVPLISARPSLAPSSSGSMPGGSAHRPRARRAVVGQHLALAEQRQRAVGERREVAAGAQRAVLGHDRGEPGVEQREHRVGHAPGARPSGPSPACAPAAASSPAPPRARPAGPSPRRASGPARAAAPRGARPGSRPSPASRTRSTRRSAGSRRVRELRHHGGALLHRRAGLVAQLHAGVAARHGHHVLRRQPRAGELDEALFASSHLCPAR